MLRFTALEGQLLHSPEDDTTGAFLSLVRMAQQSIHVIIFGFHLPVLTDTLVAKQKAGVEVSVILDHTQANGKAEQSEVQRLVDGGVPLAIGTSSQHAQIIHDKVCVVDGHLVEFGSWNYSLSASWQDNTMVITDSRELAYFFLQRHNDILSFIRTHDRMMQPHDAILARAAALAAQAPAASLGSAAALPVLTPVLWPTSDPITYYRGM